MTKLKMVWRRLGSLILISFAAVMVIVPVTVQAKTKTTVPVSLRGTWVGYDKVTQAYYVQHLTAKTWQLASGTTRNRALAAKSTKLKISQKRVAGRTFTLSKKQTKAGYWIFKNTTRGWNHTSVTKLKRIKQHGKYKLKVSYDGRNLVRDVTMTRVP